MDVVSLTERINTPLLLEGRLPEAIDECAAELPVLEPLGLSVGDTIRVTDAQGAMAEHLLQNEFVITGVIDHPDHACWQTQVPGNRNVLVLPEAFDGASLEGCFMKAEILLDGVSEADRFSEEYKTAVAEVMERLEALAVSRASLRDAAIKEQGLAQIDAGQSELQAAAEQLQEARAELDAGWSALHEGEKQIADSEQQLSEGKKQLDEGGNQLWSTGLQLSAAEAELEAARARLAESYGQFEEIKDGVRQTLRSAVSSVLGVELADHIPWASGDSAQVDDPAASAARFPVVSGMTIDLTASPEAYLEQIISSAGITEEDISDAYAAAGRERPAAGDEWNTLLADLRTQLGTTLNGYLDQYKALSDAAQAWDEGHAEYIKGKTAYDSGRTAYENALNQYSIKMAEYTQGVSALESAKEELTDSQGALEKGEARYARSLEEYEQGAALLAQAQAQVDSLDACRWVLLDISGNPSYLNIRNAVNNTADMGMTFALVFVLVGALVIYATVGRIVDEQRRLVGATKALGLFNREIFAKYLTFGVSATVLGMFLGIAAGYFGIQRILLYSYGRFYVYGAGKNAFLIGMTLAVFLIGAALSSLAVWSACSTLMRATATSLMQEKAPDIRHKEAAGERRKGSLYTRLILLNMRSDLKRVVVTVASVAGCCALLVAGFTMRQSVLKALNAQFSEITKYDMQIRFDPEVSETAQSELEALLTDAGTDWMLCHASTRTFSVDGKLLSANLLSGDLSELDRFYARLDPEEDIALSQQGEGIWVRQRVSEMNGVAAGDSITFYDSAMKPYDIPVAGVFRIYAGQEMILDTEQYEKYFGKAPENNAFFLKLDGADAQELKPRALEILGVEGVTDVGETRALYQSLAAVLDLIALMFVGIAGLMAFFILLNLVNMQVNQKKRELTIMRINGFTVREVQTYVLRESILSTALGILLGLGTGALLGHRVIRLLEGVSVRFVRGIQWEAWVLGAAITAVYAIVIHMAALRKVKALKLTDLS